MNFSRLSDKLKVIYHIIKSKQYVVAVDDTLYCRADITYQKKQLIYLEIAIDYQQADVKLTKDLAEILKK
jgi:hypothetical protein